MAVVHGIVEKHGGAIMVESAPGTGSCFEIYFPSIKKMEAIEGRIPGEIPGGSERILLIDGEQILVDMGRQILEHLGYRVETRTSSVEALALFRRQPNRYDLVITDMTMPKKTGDRLALEIMQIRRDIPIIICTGYSEDILTETAKNVGVKALVKKPILTSELARAVRVALESNR